MGIDGVYTGFWLTAGILAIGFHTLAEYRALNMDMFYLLLPFFVLFCLWLGYRILQKAGLDGRWVLILLVPIVNIIMIWAFAFSDWPNLTKDNKDDW
jgi:hypothetical protein